MQTAAFTDGNGEGAGEQANRAAEDVQNQEEEPHAFSRLNTCDCHQGAARPLLGIKQETAQDMQGTLSGSDVSSQDTLYVCSRLLAFHRQYALPVVEYAVFHSPRHPPVNRHQRTTFFIRFQIH
jgi:hypothetical protein